MSYARKGRLRQRYAKVGGHRIAVGMGDDQSNAYYQGRCSDPSFYSSTEGIMFGCQILWPDGPPAVPVSDTQQCVNDSNTATAPLLAKLEDLKKNWNPTGFYSPSDMLAVVKPVYALVHTAQSMLDQAGVATGGQSDLIEANNELFDKLAQYNNYQAAIVQSTNSGNPPINAPGFKDWVTSTMSAAIDAMTAAYVVSCTTPWWVGALATFQSGFDAVWSVCKRIVGVIIKVGDAVIKVAEKSASLLELIAEYGPYAAAAVGAYIVITELGRYKKRRS